MTEIVTFLWRCFQWWYFSSISLSDFFKKINKNKVIKEAGPFLKLKFNCYSIYKITLLKKLIIILFMNKWQIRIHILLCYCLRTWYSFALRKIWGGSLERFNIQCCVYLAIPPCRTVTMIYTTITTAKIFVCRFYYFLYWIPYRQQQNWGVGGFF